MSDLMKESQYVLFTVSSSHRGFITLRLRSGRHCYNIGLVRQFFFFPNMKDFHLQIFSVFCVLFQSESDLSFSIKKVQ